MIVGFGVRGWLYFHLPMIAGIILTAVGDELSIAHPGHHAGWAEAAAIVGGPVLYLLGNGLFKWSITGRLHRSRVVAVIVLLVLGAVTPLLPVVVVAGLAAVVLISACVWCGGTEFPSSEAGADDVGAENSLPASPPAR